MILKQSSLLLLFLVFTAYASTHSDTIHVIRDSSGPFYLPSFFYSPNSIEVHSLDTTKQIPAWRYYSSEESIRFENEVEKETILIVSYATEYGLLKRKYSRFEEVQYDSNKTITATQTALPTNNTQTSQQSISVSGEKSVGVHLGQNGEFSMDQTLDVKMFGNIGDSTILSANISDQSTSLQGDTKEIGEIDKIYLAVKNPKWDVTMGDIEIKSDSSAILKLIKTPKGISASYRSNIGESKLFGAISGHKLAVEYLSGISGVQSGAYILKGNGEPGQILPIEGTVSLTVQGKQLSEGRDGEFTIDYSIGQIKFNPRYIILDNDVIEIRYRYREFNYSKLLVGARHSFTKLNSPFTISSFITTETDNLNSNSTTLTEAEKDSLVSSGDKAPKILFGRKVHPNDVAKESVRNRLYQFNFNSSQYNFETNPEMNAQFMDLYLVSFSAIESGGEYLPFNNDNRAQFSQYSSHYLDSISVLAKDSLFLDPIFLYVGSSNGTHSAYHLAPLPERLTQGEVHIQYSPSEQFSANAIVSGISRDKNTYSEFNDQDNNSAGVKTDVYISTDPNKPFILSSDLTAEYAGVEFTDDLTSRYLLKRTWGLPIDSTRYSTVFNSIKSSINNRFSLSAGAGASLIDNHIFSHILQSKANIQATKNWINSYEILIREPDTTTGSAGRRQNFSSTLKFNAIETELSVEEEWFQTSNRINQGHLLTGISIKVPALNWTNKVEHKQNSSGQFKHHSSEKGASHTLWNQTFEKKLSEDRDISLTTNLLHKNDNEIEDLSLLLTLKERSRYLNNRFSTEVNYTVNSENATARRWQYTFVGEGVGTHIKDPITNEFLPAPFGDYIAEEIMLWANEQKSTIQNGFNFRWSYKTPFSGRKIDGINFEGILSSQEDIVPHKKGVTTAWVPMFTSISKESTDTLTYSNMQYSQQINWHPPQIQGFSTNLTSTISKKTDLPSEIKHLKALLTVRKEWNKFALIGNVNGLAESRNIISITDSYFQPNQEFSITKSWIIFLEETVGYTSLDDISGNYYAARPGIRFKSLESGNAELSYTFANLVYNGPIIYPMAKEYQKGVNHRVLLTMNINAKKHIVFNGFFRADYTEEKQWRLMTSLRATVRI